MQFFVKTLVNTSMLVDSLTPTSTIADLKAAVLAHQFVPIDQQRLIFQGRQLTDDAAALGKVGIEDGSTVHLVLRLVGGGDEEEVGAETEGGTGGSAHETPMESTAHGLTPASLTPATVQQQQPGNGKNSPTVMSTSGPVNLYHALSSGATVYSLTPQAQGQNYVLELTLPTQERVTFPNMPPATLHSLPNQFPQVSEHVYKVVAPLVNTWPPVPIVGTPQQQGAGSSSGTMMTVPPTPTSPIPPSPALVTLDNALKQGTLRIHAIQKVKVEPRVRVTAVANPAGAAANAGKPELEFYFPSGMVVEVGKKEFVEFKKSHASAFKGITYTKTGRVANAGVLPDQGGGGCASSVQQDIVASSSSNSSESNGSGGAEAVIDVGEEEVGDIASNVKGKKRSQAVSYGGMEESGEDENKDELQHEETSLAGVGGGEVSVASESASKKKARKGPNEFLRNIAKQGTTVSSIHKAEKKAGITVVGLMLANGTKKSYSIKDELAQEYLSKMKGLGMRGGVTGA
ncbi:hypothetical protein HDU98_004497 [Podochytrium sp. JEL0797]|nr:hypothetical protein HDU98_004497 [Podochytrium sp. JEL0797]